MKIQGLQIQKASKFDTSISKQKFTFEYFPKIFVIQNLFQVGLIRNIFTKGKIKSFLYWVSEKNGKK